MDPTAYTNKAPKGNRQGLVAPVQHVDLNRKSRYIPSLYVPSNSAAVFLITVASSSSPNFESTANLLQLITEAKAKEDVLLQHLDSMSRAQVKQIDTIDTKLGDTKATMTKAYLHMHAGNVALNSVDKSATSTSTMPVASQSTSYAAVSANSATTTTK
jgi:hypothetical protein